MSRIEKERFLKENYPDFHAGTVPEASAAQENILKNPVPRPGIYKGQPTKLFDTGTTELIRHPALDQYPELSKVDFRMLNEDLSPDPRIAKQPWGGYYPSVPAIAVSKGTSVYGAHQKFDPTSVAEHELQHRVQHTMGMPQGGNAGLVKFDPGFEDEQAREIVHELRQSKNPYGRSVGDALDANMQLDPHARYENITGEVQARQAQDRDLMSQDMRDATTPISRLPESVDPAVWQALRSQINVNSSPEEKARSLINILRANRNIP
jgi:hypothetical protein